MAKRGKRRGRKMRRLERKLALLRAKQGLAQPGSDRAPPATDVSTRGVGLETDSVAVGPDGELDTSPVLPVASPPALLTLRPAQGLRTPTAKPLADFATPDRPGNRALDALPRRFGSTIRRASPPA